MRLVLASASPRRQALLRGLGLGFQVVPSGLEEPLVADVPPERLATRLARAKARAVAARLGPGEPAVVLAADTLVVVEGAVLGKPADAAEARAMLRRMAGRTHAVVTGVAALATATGEELVEAVTTAVTMHPYGEEAIAAYVATGEPLDKAGAYAVQGLGARLVARVDGCYTNVVGLPVRTTARLLRALGIAVPEAVTAPAGSGPGPCAPA